MGRIILSSASGPAVVTSGYSFLLRANFSYQQETDSICYVYFMASGSPPTDLSEYRDGVLLNRHWGGGISLDRDDISQTTQYNYNWLSFSKLFDVRQIDSIVDRVFQTSEQAVKVYLWLRLYYWNGYNWIATDTEVLVWTVDVQVSQMILYGEWSLPAIARKGEALTLTVQFRAIHEVDDTYAATTSVVAKCGGRFEPLFQLSHQPFFPGGPIYVPDDMGPITIRDVDVEDIVGEVTDPIQHFDITISCWRVIWGRLWPGIEPWQRETSKTFSRQASASTTWGVDVIAAPPNPGFTAPIQYPPLSVTPSETFDLIMTVQNYGSPGVVFLKLGEQTLFSESLGYLASRVWSSGQTTISSLLNRTFTEWTEVQLTFTCGYIDESGAPVITASIPRSMIVYVPTTPPPPPPPPPDGGNGDSKTDWTPLLLTGAGAALIALTLLSRRKK